MQVEAGSVKEGFAANLKIFLVKGFAAIFTGSTGMMASAIHSLADCTNQGLLWLGIKRSRKEATEEHPFGFGKEINFWAFMVAIVLLTLGSYVGITEGIHKVMHPEPLKHIWVNLLICAVATYLDGRVWITARRELGNPDLGEMFEEVVECKNPVTVTMLVEDSGALVGLAAVFIGLSIAWITGNPIWDGIASIAEGVLLAVMSFFLANEMRKGLIGEKMDEASIRYIRRILNRHPAIQSVGEIKAMQMGPESGIVGIEVDFKDDLMDGDLDKIIPILEQQIRFHVPDAEHIFIEPHKETKSE